MTTRTDTRTLAEFAGYVEVEDVEFADALQPGDESAPVILEIVDGRVTDIVDGFHRTAGYRRWADERGLDYEAVTVTVIVSDDADLLPLAASPGPDQAEALEALYALAAESR